MKLNDYEHGCFYGKNYDLDKEKFPDPNKDYDIILCLNLKDENRRVLSSIEGLFAYNKPLENEKEDLFNSQQNFIIKREKMKEFGKKYDGEFIPCVCEKK